MTFFEDEQGRPHGPRICAVLYAVALSWGCGTNVFEPLCLARVSFTVGWWFAFCDKRHTGTLSEIILRPQNVIGLGLLTAGLIAQFRLTAGRPTVGSIIVICLVAIFSLSARKFYWTYRK